MYFIDQKFYILPHNVIFNPSFFLPHDVICNPKINSENKVSLLTYIQFTSLVLKLTQYEIYLNMYDFLINRAPLKKYTLNSFTLRIKSNLLGIKAPKRKKKPKETSPVDFFCPLPNMNIYIIYRPGSPGPRYDVGSRRGLIIIIIHVYDY